MAQCASRPSCHALLPPPPHYSPHLDGLVHAEVRKAAGERRGGADEASPAAPPPPSPAAPPRAVAQQRRRGAPEDRRDAARLVQVPRDVARAREAPREELRLRVLHLEDALEALPGRHDGSGGHGTQGASHADLRQGEAVVRADAVGAAEGRLGGCTGTGREGRGGRLLTWRELRPLLAPS